MLKSHEKFHSTNGKRLVLVVDDEMINRELLGAVLEHDYEVLFAEDGLQALELIKEYKEVLSLVLLDLIMPGMSGRELLKTMKADSELKGIPVIVLTADADAEIETFALGAIDFIPKPYPPTGVILARIFRTIELSEDRQIINSTERDPLTGLYSKDYFFSYAGQFDQHHINSEMDAIMIDINHFHMLNERYGKAYGDEVLRRIGQKLREKVRDDNGIVCRREADTFLIYCPHRDDYKEILEHASASVAQEAKGKNSRLHLRMGVYANVDKSIDIERRFDRAKQASDTIRNNYTKTIAIYDSSLHESELYAERLAGDFEEAIQDKQFKVFYQPKFDIRGDIPILVSAEALVRWEHPDLGMISPGVFIPLFEENGMIRRLDHYVWRTAAAQIKDWKERYGVVVPVSVNVSRTDMFDENLVDVFRQLLEDFDLDPYDYMLEITESAYADDSELIISTVEELQNMGFRIEMDDFGTGYSSLGMLSKLPIDALKIDMVFVRNAFGEQKDVRMLELILDIAGHLQVPVVAEGVETKEQMLALRGMGCDIAQGFYFSKPIPPSEFDHFVEEKSRSLKVHSIVKKDVQKKSAQTNITYAKIAQALAQDFFKVYYINTSDDHYMEYTVTGKERNLQVASTGSDFGHEGLVDILSRVQGEDRARVRASITKAGVLQELRANGVFSIDFQMTVDSELLHVSLKAMKVPNDENYIIMGFRNIEQQHKREEEFKQAQADSLTYASIAKALSRDYFSIYLVDTKTDEYTEYSSADEYQELKLEQSGKDFFQETRDNIMKVIHPDDIDLALSVWDKERLMPKIQDGNTFSVTYRIMMDGDPVHINFKVLYLNATAGDDRIVVAISNVDSQMKREQELNSVREKANRDALTGVKSKHAFVETERQWNERIRGRDAKAFGVVVCDINDLKQINDSMGHKTGDKYIMEASSLICNTFKHSPVFRIGGDEFVAILSGADYENREELLKQIEAENSVHRQFGGVVVACGCAIRTEGDTTFEDVFERADTAMYEAKKALKG